MIGAAGLECYEYCYKANICGSGGSRTRGWPRLGFCNKKRRNRDRLSFRFLLLCSNLTRVDRLLPRSVPIIAIPRPFCNFKLFSGNWWSFVIPEFYFSYHAKKAATMWQPFLLFRKWSYRMIILPWWFSYHYDDFHTCTIILLLYIPSFSFLRLRLRLYSFQIRTRCFPLRSSTDFPLDWRQISMHWYPVRHTQICLSWCTEKVY